MQGERPPALFITGYFRVEVGGPGSLWRWASAVRDIRLPVFPAWAVVVCENWQRTSGTNQRFLRRNRQPW
jgi:hypothetical protein